MPWWGELGRVDGRRDTFTWRGQLKGQAQFGLPTWQGFESELSTTTLSPKVCHMGQLVSGKVLCSWTPELGGSCRHCGVRGGGPHHPATRLAFVFFSLDIMSVIQTLYVCKGEGSTPLIYKLFWY